MTFDKNQIMFESEEQKAVWEVGKQILPFEIASVYITDNEMLEGFRQIYDFTVEVYGSMFLKPDDYNIKTTNFYQWHFWHLIRSHGKVTLNGNDWLIERKGEREFVDLSVYDPLIRHGVTYEITNSETAVIRSKKYPLLLKYYKMFIEKCAKLPAFGYTYIFSCDFRIFKNGFSVTLNDLIRTLPDEKSKYLTDIYNYAITNKFIVEKGKYHERIFLSYKESLCRLTIEPDRIAINFTNGNLFHSGNGEKLKRLLDKISCHENADVLKTYCLKGHIPYCNWCRKSTKNPRCGVWWEMFGYRRMLCKDIRISSNNTKGDDNKIDNRTIVLLKQILDICVEMTDEI